jgi:hypothetical protein
MGHDDDSMSSYDAKNPVPITFPPFVVWQRRCPRGRARLLQWQAVHGAVPNGRDFGSEPLVLYISANQPGQHAQRIHCVGTKGRVHGANDYGTFSTQRHWRPMGY